MNKSYLPDINGNIIFDVFQSRDWNRLNMLIKDGNYERVGFDRVFLIAYDMVTHNFGCKNNTILDLGCNNGLFSYCFAGFGNFVTGVDNGIIDTQKIYGNLNLMDKNVGLSNIKLVDDSIENYLGREDGKWDIILALSILHQFEFGYAHNEESKYDEIQIKEIVDLLFSKFKKVIYYECPYNEPGFERNYGINFLKRYLTDFEKFKIREVAKTVGPNGFFRQLLAIEHRKDV